MIDTERNADQGWPAAIGALFIGGLLFAIGLVAAGGWTWFQRFPESSAPAWIQAIGSIAAILAAAEIGQRQISGQRQLDRDRKDQEDLKKLLVIDALLEVVESSVASAKKYFNDYPNMPVFAYHLDRIKNASDALAKVDLFDCPPPVIQPLLHLFPVPCENLLATLQEFNDCFDKLGERHEKYWPGVSNEFTVQELFLGHARATCRYFKNGTSSSSNS